VSFIAGKRFALGLLCLAGFLGFHSAAIGWTTYRGNPQRTGNVDGKPGPDKPQVLWVVRSQEHFVASPVPAGDRLFLSGLGAFNVSSFYCLTTDPGAAQRTLWSKSTPYLKLPTVSSPALVGGRLVFGDGMHQTDGATLHCLKVEDGLPLWQLPEPGRLVHLEGSPTVAGSKAYLGGGAAGVLCVDIDKVSLDGTEHTIEEIQKLLKEKWTALQKKYDEEKKKDPDFAVPPSEDQLPKPVPRVVWQQGKGKWHVDAPVTVAGDRVLVASAFLDKEKEGDRALFCLDAGTGEIRWRAPLSVNPWGGPSVLNELVVVSGSTVGYDPQALKGARGEMAAFDLASGTQKWHREVKGGVVSCAALADGQAVCTATDGKIRAYDLASGEPRVLYSGTAPFFAPPTVANGVVYAGDLAGVVHALELTTGTEKWKLDLGSDPAVKAPGMIYGGPALEDGRLYLATCNLEGPHANQPTVIVCIGTK